MRIIRELLSNQYLSCAVMSWFVAQLMKIIIEISRKNKLKTKDFLLRALFGTGGMPSSHSATVTALTVGIGIKEGVGTPIFALAFIFMFVVIRDASGVRFSAGKQAHTINQIISSISVTEKIPKVKEVRGHTPLECFVGMLIGLLVSMGFFLF